jgi:pimeloyl-ACP methyl ester carboxylesterase
MELSVGGERVFASTGGQPFDPGRPGAVFLHGAGMDHSVWSLPARYFAGHGRAVLALDLPGHGRSAGKPLASIEAMAGWVLAVVEAAGLERTALVGHSMGALVALAAAARAGDRVDGIALLGVAAAMPVHPDLLAAARANDPKAVDLIASWAHGSVGHVGGNKAPGLWTMGGGIRLLERAAPGVLAADLAACADYKGALDAAGAFEGCALLVLGADDRMTPPKAAKPLVERLTGAATVTIPDTGHMMMTERPNETIAALKRLLTGA